MKIVLISNRLSKLKPIADFLEEREFKVLAVGSLDEAKVSAGNGFSETDVVILNLESAIVRTQSCPIVQAEDDDPDVDCAPKTEEEIRRLEEEEEKVVERLRRVHTIFPAADILLASPGRLDPLSSLENRVYSHFQALPDLSELENILVRIYEKRWTWVDRVGSGL